jgi:hypothetical protein
MNEQQNSFDIRSAFLRIHHPVAFISTSSSSQSTEKDSQYERVVLFKVALEQRKQLNTERRLGGGSVANACVEHGVYEATVRDGAVVVTGALRGGHFDEEDQPLHRRGHEGPDRGFDVRLGLPFDA